MHVIDNDDTGQNESLGQAIVDLKNFDHEVGYHGLFGLSDLVCNLKTRKIYL